MVIIECYRHMSDNSAVMKSKELRRVTTPELLNLAVRPYIDQVGDVASYQVK